MMTLIVSGRTRAKLEHIPERLQDEFTDTDVEEVEQEVGDVAAALLEEARFEDFVPLLTYRYAREHLVDGGHAPRRGA